MNQAPSPISRRAALSLMGGAATGQSRGERRPNVLFLLPDQVRSQDLGGEGGVNVATPHIDRLMRQGTTFTNALSTCPLCTPYRGMLLSGQYPTHTGVVINWLDWDASGPSLGTVFRDAGYRTGYIGKWHLTAGKMKRDGLLMSQEARQLEAARDYSVRPQVEVEYVRANPEPEFVPPGPQRRGFDYWAAYNFHTEFRKSYYYRDTPQRLIYPRYETDGQIDLAIEFMRGAAREERPFFLAVSPHPPHQPWIEAQSPAGYLERVRNPLAWRKNVPAGAAKPANDSRYYYAMLANLDDAIGRLTDFLDTAGLRDNTLVVFTSDHGEMMGSHGKWEKMTPYEEAVRVPLSFRWPGRIPDGRRADALYTPMDHLPTLARLAGLTPPGGLDGIDLSGWVRDAGGGGARDSALMMNYSSHWDYFHTEWPWPEWRAVRTRQHTYVKWYAGPEEMYDNAADPYQMDDLARRDTATAARLRSRLKDLLAESHDEFGPGPAYARYCDEERKVVRTGKGPVRRL